MTDEQACREAFNEYHGQINPIHKGIIAARDMLWANSNEWRAAFAAGQKYQSEQKSDWEQHLQAENEGLVKMLNREREKSMKLVEALKQVIYESCDWDDAFDIARLALKEWGGE